MGSNYKNDQNPQQSGRQSGNQYRQSYQPAPIEDAESVNFLQQTQRVDNPAPKSGQKHAKKQKPQKNKGITAIIVLLSVLIVAVLAVGAIFLFKDNGDKDEDHGGNNVADVPSAEDSSSTAESTEDDSVESNADDTDSGTFGTLNWSFEYGTLTIGGSGSIGSNDADDKYASYPWDKYQGKTKHLVIQEGVERIGGFAFSAYDAIESISFPSSLKGIGYESFSDCTSLKQLVLPEGVEKLNDGSFNRCTSLESINLPSTLTGIDDAMFANCTSLKTITVHHDNPYLFTKEGALFFKYEAEGQDTDIVLLQFPLGVSNWTYWTLPDGVTFIHSGAFAGSRLETVTLPASLEGMGYGVFADCTSLTNLSFKGTVQQWNAVERREGWNNGAAFTSVVCSDGMGSTAPSDGGDYSEESSVEDTTTEESSKEESKENSTTDKYITTAAKTNYARKATYTISRDGETDPAYLFLSYSYGTDWADENCTKLNDGKVGDITNEAYGTTTALVGTTVQLVGTGASYEFLFDLGKHYADIKSFTFRQVRNGTEWGDNRGFDFLYAFVSDDGVTWNTKERLKGTLTCKEVPNAPGIKDKNEQLHVQHFDYTYTLDTPAKGRYVKIFLTNDTGYVLQIEEIEIWNK